MSKRRELSSLHGFEGVFFAEVGVPTVLIGEGEDVLAAVFACTRRVDGVAVGVVGIKLFDVVDDRLCFFVGLAIPVCDASVSKDEEEFGGVDEEGVDGCCDWDDADES